MTAFDQFGAVLGMVTASDSTAGLTLALSIPGIQMVRISQDSPASGWDGTIALDNLTFNPLQAVPEPGSYAILAMALLLIRAAKRPQELHKARD